MFSNKKKLIGMIAGLAAVVGGFVMNNPALVSSGLSSIVHQVPVAKE